MTMGAVKGRENLLFSSSLSNEREGPEGKWEHKRGKEIKFKRLLSPFTPEAAVKPEL